MTRGERMESTLARDRTSMPEHGAVHRVTAEEGKVFEKRIERLEAALKEA